LQLSDAILTGSIKEELTKIVGTDPFKQWTHEVTVSEAGVFVASSILFSAIATSEPWFFLFLPFYYQNSDKITQVDP